MKLYLAEQVGDFLAREKTSQAFRDALHDQYRSSNLSKKINKRRKAELLGKAGLGPKKSCSLRDMRKNHARNVLMEGRSASLRSLNTETNLHNLSQRDLLQSSLRTINAPWPEFQNEAESPPWSADALQKRLDHRPLPLHTSDSDRSRRIELMQKSLSLRTMSQDRPDWSTPDRGVISHSSGSIGDSNSAGNNNNTILFLRRNLQSQSHGPMLGRQFSFNRQRSINSFVSSSIGPDDESERSIPGSIDMHDCEPTPLFAENLSNLIKTSCAINENSVRGRTPTDANPNVSRNVSRNVSNTSTTTSGIDDHTNLENKKASLAGDPLVVTSGGLPPRGQGLLGFGRELSFRQQLSSRSFASSISEDIDEQHSTGTRGQAPGFGRQIPFREQLSLRSLAASIGEDGVDERQNAEAIITGGGHPPRGQLPTAFGRQHSFRRQQSAASIISSIDGEDEQSVDITDLDPTAKARHAGENGQLYDSLSKIVRACAIDEDDVDNGENPFEPVPIQAIQESLDPGSLNHEFPHRDDVGHTQK